MRKNSQWMSAAVVVLAVTAVQVSVSNAQDTASKQTQSKVPTDSGANKDLEPAVDTSKTPPPSAFEPAVDTSNAPPPSVLKPGVDTSNADSPNEVQASTDDAAPGGPNARKGRSTARSSGKAMDRLELDTTAITGNRELPKVLYIVPWKRSDLGDLLGKPVNSLLDEVLTPVDRDVFKRENRYFTALDSSVPPTEAAGATSPGASDASQNNGAQPAPSAPK